MLYSFEGDPEQPGTLRDAIYCGVGFFARRKNWSAFVTVSHVVPEKLKSNERIGIADIRRKQPFWFEEVLRHPVADLACFPVPIAEVPEGMQTLPILENLSALPQGTSVGSYGFPFTDRRPPEQGGPLIYFSSVYYSGYIAAAWNQEYLFECGIRSAFQVNYGLSFDCPGGLSGAPLFAAFGGTMYACGLVYGNWRTEQTLEEFVEEYQDERRTERVRINRVVRFGMASGVEELRYFEAEPRGPQFMREAGE
jgi:hypothetical protein